MRAFTYLWMLLASASFVIIVACNGKNNNPPSWREINRTVLSKILKNKNTNAFAASDSGGGQGTMSVVYCMNAYSLSDSGGGQDTMRVTKDFHIETFALNDSGGGQDTMYVGGRSFIVDYHFSRGVTKSSEP